MPHLSANAERILAVVSAIPCGQVLGYGEVAACAGLPGRARLVSWALKQAPPGSDLPWHRVLRANRSIAFPAGSAAYREQRKRLLAEGVKLVNGKAVDRRTDSERRSENDLDRALWGPES